MIITSDKVPFEFTPHIFRYLETLIEISEKTFAPQNDSEVSIDNYFGGEAKSPEIELNSGAFWNYMEHIGAVKITHEKGFEGLEVGKTIEGDVVEAGGVHTLYLAKTYLRVVDLTKIKMVLAQREARKIIHSKTLELIARDMAGSQTGTDLLNLLKENGIPNKVIVYPETKWRMLNGVFRVLATSPNSRANKMLYKIIEAAVHPLFFNGDEVRAKQSEEKYNGWLKYNRIAIDKGKVFIGPTEEEMDLGVDDWVNSDGQVVEPKGMIYDPRHVATLWVMWTQLINIITAYTANKGNRAELEKLYLKVIGIIEEIVKWQEVGGLKEKYERPFTSLQTAEIEARARQFNLPLLDALSPFLIEITSLNPDPTLISKKMDEYTELLGQISLAMSVSGTSAEPKKVISSFDRKAGTLVFSGQEIGLSNKGKETDSVLLMETLLKAEDAEWKHNDEILADWGYTEADIKRVAKNKVYQAGKKVNTAVALKTSIDDFLECNTAKARINPKYKKVYE